MIYLQKKDDGINFISRTSKRNGVSAKVKPIPFIFPFSAGLLTVAVSGNVLETFLQPQPFYTGFHVMVLSPKVEMNTAIKLYYCQCIRQNRYKYNYGRQANSTLSELEIPTLESIPDYIKDFSIKEYCKKLLCKSNLQCVEANYNQTNQNVPLDKLFVIENGVASSQIIRSKTKENNNWIPYIRPSYRQETSIDAFVNKRAVSPEKIFPAQTLYVSTDGQGSHTYSYVSTFEFVPNSNVSVLIPRRSMSLQEKLFYAQCITQNRYKFSYGRKPKGEKLKKILLPEFPPDYILQYNIEKLFEVFEPILDKL